MAIGEVSAETRLLGTFRIGNGVLDVRRRCAPTYPRKKTKKNRAHEESNPALWVVVPAQFETTARLLTIFRNQVECSIECSIECSMARWQRSMAMFDGNVRDNGKAICLNQHLLVPMYNVMYFRRLFGACRLRTTGG